MTKQTSIAGVVGLLLLACVGRSEALGIKLWWEYTATPDPAVVGFYIYRQPQCTGAFTRLTPQPVPPTQRWYLDTDVQMDKTYCHYATAVNALGMESVPSATAQFSLQRPPAPKLLPGEVVP